MPRLHLHGPPRVALDDGGERALAAREAALIAWLHLEGPAPRQRLATLLWPGGSEAQSRANLRQALARLKRAHGPLLAEDRGGLRLAVPVAEAAVGEPLLGTLHFDDADELSAWLEARRDDARRADLRRRHDMLRALIDRADWPTALRASEALLAADRESEESWRLRMEVLAGSGDRAAAVAAWDDCRLMLRQVFGIQPSAATHALGQRILAGDTTSAAGLPAALHRPPRLAGRERLLGELKSALAAGHAVVLAGTAGIGKSRLLAELAATGSPALRVAARPGDAATPWSLLMRLLAMAQRQFGPALDDAARAALDALRDPPLPAEAPAAAAEQARRLRAASRALAACRDAGLALVAIDDLQFADSGSLQGLQTIVGHWLAAPPANRLALALAYRADELPPAAQPFVEMLLASGQSARFEPAALDVAALRALIDELPAPALGSAARDALAHTLHAQVGGNPAFVLECLKSLWQRGLEHWHPGRPLPLPQSLLASVQARLQRLPGDAMPLAQLMAVAGSDFSLSLAGHALGRAPLALAPALAALESAQLVDEHGFAHDLVADAVRATVGPSLRPALHRMVAEHLAAHGGGAAVVAEHFAAAGHIAEAAPWQHRAAEQARSRGQFRGAAERFEAAATGFDAARDRVAALAAWHDTADTALAIGDHGLAERALASAERLVADPAERLPLASLRTVMLYNQRRVDAAVAEGEALADAVVGDVAQLPPRHLLGAVRAAAAIAPFSQRPEGALALCDAVRPQLDLAEADTAIVFGRAHGMVLNWLGHAPRAIDALRPVMRRLRQRRHPGLLAGTGAALARALHMAGRNAEAAATCDQMSAVLADAEPGVAEGIATDLLHFKALMLLALGRLRDARTQMRQLIDHLAAEGKPCPGTFTDVMAQIALAAGDLDGAARWAARHPPVPPGQSVVALMHGWLRVQIAGARGDDTAALLQEAGTNMASPAVTVATLKHRVMQVRWQALPYDEVAALAALLRERGLRGMQRAAEAAAARAAMAQHDLLAAAAHARAALTLADALDPGCDEMAGVWATASTVLQAAGAHAEARAAHDAGVAWLQRTAAHEFEDEASRRRFLQGHASHRALLAGAAETTG